MMTIHPVAGGLSVVPREKRLEEERQERRKMASSGRESRKSEEGGRHVALHPLAIVGVSDHLTRVKLGGSKQPSNSPVLGLLFGKQTDQEVSIFDAIEAAYELRDVNGHVEMNAEGERVVTREDFLGHSTKTLKLDENFLAKQIELYTAVYKDKELLGWYAVSENCKPTPTHLRLHKDFLKYNESPLFLCMDPVPSTDAKELPINIYEAELHVVDASPTMLFVAVPYSLETLQAESIAMEQVTQSSANNGDVETALYATVDQSLKTLHTRVIAMVDYLKRVDNNEMPIDYTILRDLSCLVDKLPTAKADNGNQFSTDNNTDFLKDLNDSLAVAYLATITKSAGALHDLVDKFGVVHQHHSTTSTTSATGASSKIA